MRAHIAASRDKLAIPPEAIARAIAFAIEQPVVSSRHDAKIIVEKKILRARIIDLYGERPGQIPARLHDSLHPEALHE